MGYSTSKETIQRVETVLDLVLKMDGKQVSFPTKNPRKLTYAIRDALHSCKHFHTEYGHYLKINEQYKIVQGDKKVTFVPKEIEFGAPIEELQKAYEAQSEFTFEKCSEALEIIGALIEHKPAKAIFPNAPLKVGLDMTKIAGWCHKNNYSITEIRPLTIVKQ